MKGSLLSSNMYIYLDILKNDDFFNVNRNIAVIKSWGKRDGIYRLYQWLLKIYFHLFRIEAKKLIHKLLENCFIHLLLTIEIEYFPENLAN